MAFPGQIPHIHNNETKSLTFTESLTFMKHRTQKRSKHKKVRTADYITVHICNDNGSSNNLPCYPPDSH